MTWFDVSKDGLAAILERRGKVFALAELISNAWDSGSDRVEVRLTPIPGSPYATIEVEDWGEGFSDLSHAFTMFARSGRADKPDLRGRFNLGEKLVLAICRKATITSTTGSIAFEDAARKRSSVKRDNGTLFSAEIRMTRNECEEATEFLQRMIPPVPTVFNGEALFTSEPIGRFSTRLPTELAGTDGNLRRTVRQTEVDVYEAAEGQGELLELGVPVVELPDCRFRVNVLQKVPLNLDRDNVTPSFLRAVRTALLNHVFASLTPDEATKPWVQEASGDARATGEAVRAVVTARFGERAVIATVGDPLANAQAEAAGFTVIPGGALSGDVWANVRKNELLLPSSRVFPSMKPDQVAAQAEQTCPLCGR